MKTLLLSIVLGLVSFAASAEPISLQAGSTIVINGQIIACEGPAIEDLAPLCSIRQDGTRYRLYAGETVVNTYYNFDDALLAAGKVRATGLCR